MPSILLALTPYIVRSTWIQSPTFASEFTSTLAQGARKSATCWVHTLASQVNEVKLSSRAMPVVPNAELKAPSGAVTVPTWMLFLVTLVPVSTVKDPASQVTGSVVTSQNGNSAAWSPLRVVLVTAYTW